MILPIVLKEFDPDLLERAIERATDLLLSIVGGQAGPVSKVCDENYLKVLIS